MDRPQDGDRPVKTQRPELENRPQDGDRIAKTKRPALADLPQDGDRITKTKRPALADLPQDGDRIAALGQPQPMSCGRQTAEGKRPLVLGARLEAALAMTLPAGETACVADIGCDHGRLIVTMLERFPKRRGIAADISAPSLEKARVLAERRNVAGRLSVRLGDGLSVLDPGEADAVILCGMGGELIAELLNSGARVLAENGLAVCQPMRGTEELLRFLWENGWYVMEDTVVEDAGRLYEVLSAQPPKAGRGLQPVPTGFPEDFFAIGFTAVQSGSKTVKRLVLQQLYQAEKRLKTAAGTAGEAVLQKKKAALETILQIFF